MSNDPWADGVLTDDHPWTEHLYDEGLPERGRRSGRMALAAASALIESVPPPQPANPPTGGTGSSNTKPSQRKSKRRAKGKAQRRARRKNRA